LISEHNWGVQESLRLRTAVCVWYGVWSSMDLGM